MECRSRKAKKQFLTRADAERQVQNAKKGGVHLYAYQCSCNYWHLATVKPKPKSFAVTDGEWRNIKHRVKDLARQFANEEDRANRRRFQELDLVVAQDREWLRRMKDADEFHEACAKALRKMLDAHFATEGSTGVQAAPTLGLSSCNQNHTPQE